MVSFDQVLIFKKDIMERFGLYLHFHDGCGGFFQRRCDRRLAYLAA